MPLPTDAPTVTPLPTDAPTVTRTATPRPSPTRVPFTPMPTTTDTPTGPTPIPFTGSVSAPGGGAHHVTGVLSLEAERTTFAAGERIWFTFDLDNASGQGAPYGILGVVVIDLDPSDGSGGLFHTSWDGGGTDTRTLTLNPGPFHHRDHLAIAVPGVYHLYVSMCFSAFNVCRGGGDWENLSGPIVVSIH